MGYSVINKNIKMTRGDTVKLHVSISRKQTGEPYIPQEGDTIVFSVKKKYSDAVPLIQKIIPNDTQYLIIDPEDTKDLPFGSYHYDIELIDSEGNVDTFIEDSIIDICYEIG